MSGELTDSDIENAIAYLNARAGEVPDVEPIVLHPEEYKFWVREFGKNGRYKGAPVVTSINPPWGITLRNGWKVRVKA